jgi:hypothetical protein
VHALWTGRERGEEDAPAARIIHALHAGFGGTAPVRAGIRAARGYRKCGSRDETDQIRDIRVHAWRAEAWELRHEWRDLARAADDAVTWLPVDVPDAAGVLVEVRRSWVDDWWPSWNLVSRGLVVEAPQIEVPTVPATPLPHHVDLAGLPAGLDARLLGGEVRYRSRTLEVGFRLGRPAVSFLAIDPDGLPERAVDLLRHANLYEGDGNDWITNHPLVGQFALGPQLVTPDGLSHLGQYAAVTDGHVEVRGASVTYELRLPTVDHRLRLRWTVGPDHLLLEASRWAARPLLAVESSAWHVAFDCRVSPPCLLGRPARRGEVGLTRPPATLHVPGHGSLAITCVGDVDLRFEAARPLMATGLEIKLGEGPGPLGEWRIPAGSAEGSVRFEVTHGPAPELSPDTPLSVRDAVRRAWLTGMTYRLDTTALSNNGNSIHVPASLETWAPLAVRVGAIDAATHALDLVRDTIERYLDGAPGYGAGRTSFHGGLLQDEYLATDPSVLLGLAHLVAASPDDAWLERRAGAIRALIDRVRAHDVDADGLIECDLRRGITGSGAWSSNLADIVSFGWKDAYTNAILFDALDRLASMLPDLGGGAPTPDLAAWRERLRASYLPAFWNDDTGWLAGWRSADGALHDAGYLWVNGAAVTAGLLPEDLARSAISRLWDEIRERGFSDFRLGLPLNARSIARGDMVERFEGMAVGYVMPHGFDMNGAASLTGARHFIRALAQVGMRAESDAVIEAVCSAVADGTAFGGCTSGVDLRTWDGTPCGYEGILTDQFGVLIAALERHGTATSSGRTASVTAGRSGGGP